MSGADQERDAMHDALDRWARYVASAISLDAIEQPDESDDIDELRESLVRQRVAAAAERQAHEARGVVVDVLVCQERGEYRCIVATATGDRREERELLIEAISVGEVVRRGASQDLEYARLVCFLFGWLLGGEP